MNSPLPQSQPPDSVWYGWILKLFHHWKVGERQVTYVWAVIVGVVGASMSLFFEWTVEVIQWLLTGIWSDSRVGTFSLVEPEWRMFIPVAGGLVAGVIVFLLNVFFGLTFKFQTQLQTAFMLMFFSSIGLSADFTRLRAGGKPLAVFLMVVAVFIVVQNTVGVGLAAALGLDPLIGLVTGSITLTGGHGTAGAWGPVLESKYGITGATTLGIATATFGLVAGVWTRDGARQFRMARRIASGQVFINNYGAAGGVELPFGGVKSSGHGREKGFEALYGFTTLKTVAIRHG